MNSRFALQTFTVRMFLKSPAAIESGFARIKAAGINAVELDTYWVARGGRSPQDMIRDQHGRVKVVHLRDFRLQWRAFMLKPVDCELGNGNLDFKRIVDSCIDSGVH